MGETVPMLLINSIRGFATERIGRLIEYLADGVPRVVCALFRDDTAEIEASATVSAEQLNAD